MKNLVILLVLLLLAAFIILSESSVGKYNVSKPAVPDGKPFPPVPSNPRNLERSRTRQWRDARLRVDSSIATVGIVSDMAGRVVTIRLLGGTRMVRCARNVRNCHSGTGSGGLEYLF